jgi:Transmembrane secretion effector
MHWPEPVMMIDTEASEGPAITLVEYRIDPKTDDEFLEAMKEMKRYVNATVRSAGTCCATLPTRKDTSRVL